jgi:hypothetical protein
MRHAVPVLLLALGVVACGDGAPPRADGLVVTRDSTAEAVVVAITGDIPADQVRQLQPDLVIAPDADDTSLFTTVWEFDVDQWDRIWAYDNDANTIFVFERDGTLVRRIGRTGAGPGEFRQNMGMIIRPDGGLAQWDGTNGRITILDSTGTYVGSWPVPTTFGTMNGLVGGPDGTIYMRRPVTEPRPGEILGRMGLVAIRPDGTFGDSLVLPELSIARAVYVAQQGGGRSSSPARYGPTDHWGLTAAGEIVQVNGATYELVVARRSGQALVVRRTVSEIPVDPNERQIEEALVTWRMQRTQPDWSWNGPPLPTTKAPVTGMGVVPTRDGRLWVQVAVPSEQIPDADRVPPRDSTMPVMTYRMPMVYEVFEADGTLLGRVAMPRRTSLVDADSEAVWGLATDDDGLPQLVRFRVEPGWGTP